MIIKETLLENIKSSRVYSVITEDETDKSYSYSIETYNYDYYTHKLKDKTYFVGFKAKTLDENFMKIVADFFSPYKKQSTTYGDLKKEYNEKSPLIEKFIQEHKDTDYTIEDFQKLLIQIDKTAKNISEKDIEELYTKHVNKKYNEMTFNKRYVKPYYADLTMPEFKVMDQLKEKELAVGKENIKLIHKINLVVEDEKANDDALIKDYEYDPNTELKYYYSVNKLPLSTKVFYDYVNSLTIGEIKKIWKKIPLNLSAAKAVESAQIILEETNSAITLKDAQKAYDAYFQKTNGELDARSYITLHTLIFEHYNSYDIAQKAAVRLLCNYFIEAEKIYPNHHELIFKAFSETFNKWIKSRDNVAYVLDTLTTKIGAVETFNIIIDVTDDENTVLTATQWKTFITDYDDYSKMPFSIWVNLI